MDIALWILQILLALVFLGAGATHAFRFDQFAARPRTAWATDVGRARMRLIGLAEIAGGIGLIAPAVTGILPWLTPLAAAGLALVMLAAVGFHARRRGEESSIAIDTVLGALALVVVVGRAFIEPASPILS